MKYIGIDIGVSGAIAVIEDMKILDLIAMPVLQTTKNKKEYDMKKIIDFLKKYKNSTAILEKTQAMPKLGTVQAHQLGKGSGIMMGILSTLGIRHHIIHPKTWQSKILKDCPGNDTKTKSIIAAQRLFPNENFLRTDRSKKVDHNFCDAVLIAFFGQKHMYE